MKDVPIRLRVLTICGVTRLIAPQRIPNAITKVGDV